METGSPRGAVPNQQWGMSWQLEPCSLGLGGASLREATASPAAAETPKWWDLVEQQAV